MSTRRPIFPDSSMSSLAARFDDCSSATSIARKSKTAVPACAIRRVRAPRPLSRVRVARMTLSKTLSASCAAASQLKQVLAPVMRAVVCVVHDDFV